MLGPLVMISGYTGGKSNYYWIPSRIYNNQDPLAGAVQIQAHCHGIAVSSSAGGSLGFMKGA